MAFIQFEFKSETLSLSCQVNVAFSQRIKRQLGSDHRSPVLYLLHGLSDDHSGWMRKSSIERYVENYDLIVVMPAVHRSFYRNTYSGYRYFDYIADELPELCRTYFQTSSEPEKNFVAGLSMGGYGAFKLALTRPHQYAAAASMSGALDLAGLSERRDELLPEWPHVFGPEIDFATSDDNLLNLASRRISEGAPLPRLYQSCGTEDYIYPINKSFIEHARQIGLPVDYEEGPGEHDWGYWDKQIQRVLDWLPLKELEKPGNNPFEDSTQYTSDLS